MVDQSGGGGRTARPASWLVRRVLVPAEDWLTKNSVKFTVTGILVILLFALLAPLMFHNLSPGQVGVIWRRFGGTDVNRYLLEGLQVVYPWDRVYKYQTRLQREERDFEVLSEDGLTISVRIAWRYSLNEQYVGLLHQYIGPDYNNVLLAPDIAERTRDVFAANRPDEIWTNRRSAIQRDILQSVRASIGNSFKPPGYQTADFIHLEDILVTGLTLPVPVQQSIVRKNVENQRQQEMDYRLLYERKEAERKSIEADGVRQFQEVVSYGLTNSYLQWRGIEATLELAKSNNAKVVIVGNSANGLPIILGGVDKEMPTPPPPDGMKQGTGLERPWPHGRLPDVKPGDLTELRQKSSRLLDRLKEAFWVLAGERSLSGGPATPPAGSGQQTSAETSPSSPFNAEPGVYRAPSAPSPLSGQPRP